MAESLRILIVDEDPDSRVDARKAVQRAQFAVAGEVGYGAAAASSALDTHPDLVLLAAEEPAVRALDTLEAMAGVVPNTPFVVYSSARDPEAIRRSMVMGAKDYIVKPVQSTRLREAVHTILEREERRQMQRAGQMLGSLARGSVIAVTGAKGGIGKTVVSVNLAIGLRQQTGASVAIVDADSHFGDVATMLDVYPSETITDVISLLGRLDRESIKGLLTPHASGVHVLAGPGDEGWEGCDLGKLKEAIRLLAEAYDYVVVDAGELIGGTVQACIESSTLVFLVTSGEVSSIRDTASALRRIASWPLDSERLKVVLNRGSRVNGFHVEDVQEAIGREVFWQTPYDRHVPVSIQVGQPVMLTGKSEAAQNLAALARRIAGTRTPLVQTQSETPPPLWKRLMVTR